MKNAVLVIGDVMLDQQIEGRMTRVSPEAASPVVVQDHVENFPGGAANVAANLAALQTTTCLVGVVGHDWAGGTLSTMVPETYGITNLLVADQSYRTVVKTRVTCGGHQVMRIDQEDDSPREQHNHAVIRGLQGLFGDNCPIKLIVVADYNKGTVTPEIAAYLKQMSGQHGVPIFVDCKPANAHLYEGVALLKPNLKEATELSQDCIHPAAIMGDEEDRAVVMAKHLHAKLGVGCVVITRGPNGATCYDGNADFTSSVVAQEVFDVAGAGDTFMATMADSYMRGYDLPSSILRANTAAGHAVAHHGTYIVNKRELEAAVRVRRGVLGKVLTLEKTVELVRDLKSQEQRVVLTNGCYRTIHHGHMSLLKWAASQGHALVLAINSDESIRGLKGDVPVVPQEYRVELLASLPYVDAVTVFDDTDVTETVKAIKPDILVKGAEYVDQFVPGGDYVASRGGQVLFAPMVPGASSSVFDA